MLKNVLIIDSDMENYNQTAANLRDQTTEVHYAATVAAALQKIQACEYCFIIMDVFLADGGHEVILELRRRTSMPILALSEQAGTADMVLALESGADDFLAKAYSREECFASAWVLLRRYVQIHPFLQRSYVLVSHKDIVIDIARRIVSISKIVDHDGNEYKTITFGPVSILPHLHRKEKAVTDSQAKFEKAVSEIDHRDFT